MSILRLNEFKALPGKFEALSAKMADICARIRTLDGCEQCELLLKVADGENPDEALIVREVWTSVEAHKAAAANIDPAEFAEVMTLLADRPTGQYYAAVST